MLCILSFLMIQTAKQFSRMHGAVPEQQVRWQSKAGQPQALQPPGTHLALGLWDAFLYFDPHSSDQLIEKSDFLGRLII